MERIRIASQLCGLFVPTFEGALEHYPTLMANDCGSASVVPADPTHRDNLPDDDNACPSFDGRDSAHPRLACVDAIHTDWRPLISQESPKQG